MSERPSSTNSVSSNAPASIYKPVTHCIFNAAGVILDVMPLYEEALKRVCNAFEKELTSELLNQVLGLSEIEAAEILIEYFGLPVTIDALAQQLNLTTNELLTDVQLVNGIQRLLNHLHKNKIPMAVTTSTSDVLADKQAEKYKALYQMFHHRVCAASDPDVTENKPAPDVYLVAASRFPDKPKPEKCLVFEFSPLGVTAGNAAGMQTVMLPDSHVHEDLCTAATLVLKSLDDFKPEDFGLPAYKE